MSLTIDALAQAGAFAGKLVRREVKATIAGVEHEFVVYVKPLSYAAAVTELIAGPDKLRAVAERIATSICDEQGRPIMTAADVEGTANPERGPLDGNLTLALLSVIAEVNDLGNEHRPRSRGRKSSGTS